MTAPRLEIDLDKIYHNAHTLVELLAENLIEDEPHPFDAKPHLATNV